MPFAKVIDQGRTFCAPLEAATVLFDEPTETQHGRAALEEQDTRLRIEPRDFDIHDVLCGRGAVCGGHSDRRCVTSDGLA